MHDAFPFSKTKETCFCLFPDNPSIERGKGVTQQSIDMQETCRCSVNARGWVGRGSDGLWKNGGSLVPDCKDPCLLLGFDTVIDFILKSIEVQVS